MVATRFLELTGLLDLTLHPKNDNRTLIYCTLYGQPIGQLTIHPKATSLASHPLNKQRLTPFKDTFLVWTDLANSSQQIESWEALQNLIRYQLETHPAIAYEPYKFPLTASIKDKDKSALGSFFAILKHNCQRFLRFIKRAWQFLFNLPLKQPGKNAKALFELAKAKAKEHLKGGFKAMLGLVSRTNRPIVEQFAPNRPAKNLTAQENFAGQSRLGSIEYAINRALENRYSSQEKNWIERLENLRNTLSTSTTEFEQLDFGAKPDTISNLTDATSRIVTRTVNEFYNSSCVTSRWALLLFSLIRELKPICCLELGTALGVSTAYQAAALDLNGDGKIVTLEGAPALADLAQANLESLNLHNINFTVGRFLDTLTGVLDKLQSIDFVFIDGHHDENATQLYFQKILPYLNNEAIIIFDDINWSAGMKRAWQAINGHPQVTTWLDLTRFGICIVQKTPSSQLPECFFWLIDD